MQQNGLLKKDEQKMLLKNLLPQAPNATVTIALLAQVLQQRKSKAETNQWQTTISKKSFLNGHIRRFVKLI